MSKSFHELVADLSEIKALLSEQEDRIAAIRTRYASTLDQLRAICPHETTKESSIYFEGSYYDKASTTYQTHCAVCGLKLDENTVTHNYYG